MTLPIGWDDDRKNQEAEKIWGQAVAAGIAYVSTLGGKEALVIYNEYENAKAGSPLTQGLIDTLHLSFDPSGRSSASALSKVLLTLEETKDYQVDHFITKTDRPVTIVTPKRLVQG